jgi:predicted HTH domain antitoxin
MPLVIPDDLLRTAGLTDQDLRREVAILLFEQDRLTLGQASQFAGMSRLAFQHLLASRGLSLHYAVADFEDDLAALRPSGRS